MFNFIRKQNYIKKTKNLFKDRYIEIYSYYINDMSQTAKKQYGIYGSAKKQS